MKISAPIVFSNPDVRQDAAKSLAAGKPVYITEVSGHESEGASKLSAPEISRAIEAGSASITSVSMNQGAQNEFTRQGIQIGAGGGAVIGLGVGMVIDLLREAHPSSALVFGAACALIGAGTGGVMGAVVGSKQYNVKITYDGHWGTEIKPAA